VHPALVATEAPGPGVAGPAGANGELVLGFGSLSAFRERSGYSATAEDSVYVDRAQRGRGVGRALLAELLRLAAAHGFHSVIARIAGHNEMSIGLHKAAGFELVGVEREVGRKHRQWLDVVELQRLL
jgi:phosphinothricin acetyltransferase